MTVMSPHPPGIRHRSDRGEFGIHPAALQLEFTEPFGDRRVVAPHQGVDKGAKHELSIRNV
jgi:hypothetical protein